MSDLNLYSVNWQDGMLVTQQHLKEQESFFENLSRWYALGVNDSWGLARKSSSGLPALSLNLSGGGEQLRVEVVRCQAITADGGVIDINENSQNIARAQAKIDDERIPVFVGVSPAGKKEVGEPDPQEDVPRVPYLTGNYAVTLGQPPNLPNTQFLQVAELVVSGSEISHAADYYPPCLTIHADERLTQKAMDYRNRLENLLSLASRAYMAVAADGALKGEKTGLQNAFKQTIFATAAHLSGSLDEFVVGHNAGHPLGLTVFFKRLFRQFTTLLNLHPGLKDYLNEKFFVKEMNSDVGRFMSTVDAFLLADYDHRNLGFHIKAIDDILGQVRGVLGFLAQVKKDDLGPQAVATDTVTYLGRTYRVAEYGGCRLEQVGGLSYLMIDLPDPIAISDMVALMGKDLLTTGEWTSMQVRLGLNDARGLGETDPVEVDVTTFGNKVALRPQDMLKSNSVRQITLVLRGSGNTESFDNLGKMDLIVYTV